MALTLGVVVVVIGGCSHPISPASQFAVKTDVPMAADETAQIPARREMKAAAIKSIEEVATKLNDPEVNELVAFFKQNATLVLPRPEGFRVLDALNSERPFYLACLVPEDSSLNETWAQSVSGDKAVASFQPDVRLMVLRDQKSMTSVWNAVYILHETHHARDFLLTPYDWQDTRTFCMKELAVHEFQNRIVARLGGEIYKAALNDEVVAMRKKVFDSGLKIGQGLPGCPDYEARLDRIFGPAKNEYEQRARMSSLWIHGLFELIDRYDKNGDDSTKSQDAKEEDKALTMKTIYRQNEVLPNP
ncbi:MAG: hypothetical protein NTW79_04295 [Candidatus Berkelbacteria bacterium]|nr:hypothetical protein [Candidatus Berkelbacteria bacterium]